MGDIFMTEKVQSVALSGMIPEIREFENTFFEIYIKNNSWKRIFRIVRKLVRLIFFRKWSTLSSRNEKTRRAVELKFRADVTCTYICKFPEWDKMFRAVSSVMCVLVAQSAAKHLRSIDSAGSIPPEVQTFCSFDTEHLWGLGTCCELQKLIWTLWEPVQSTESVPP